VAETDARRIGVPEHGLVLLVGVSGSGKSTFAAQHFLPTQVISSDFCRGLVADDENDQDATRDAFDVLHYIVGTRLRRGLLTVVDATNVQQHARTSLIELAKEHDVLVDAIVLDVPEAVALERNRHRPDRDFGPHVVARQHRDLRKGLSRMGRGMRRLHVLHGEDEIAAATVVTERAWNDLRDRTGPFDIVGDVHGCASELSTLLTELGWTLEVDHQGRAVGASHPERRTAVFVGDLVDRGPDTPGVLRLVMGMVAAGTALCVSGNHEAKLVRALKGAQVTVAHGLAESLEQLAREPEPFREEVLAFMGRLLSHYVLDDGRLVVAHAGLKEAYHGRSSGRVRSFALYGDTTGETDEFGLPVRYPWARDYRGRAMVVYGHTPVPETEWVNNTICLDTGVVFGGTLTALRYPSKEIVSVPAEQQWFEPVRPLVAAPTEREPGTLRLDDVLTLGGPTWLSTTHAGKVKIPAENAAAALEVMSRFAVDPRWLLHLPATMAPAPATHEGAPLDWHALEHPERAFDAYAKAGVTRVVCEEKHMGSRAVVVLARDVEVAATRFGVTDGTSGMVHTRTGRPFFDPALTATLVDRLRESCLSLFDSLDTDWLVLDAELLPWSAKALGLIREQYAATGAAAHHALPAVQAVLAAADSRGLDVGALADRTARRTASAEAFRDVYAAYYRPVDGLDGITLAPFQVLAAEGRVLAATEPHPWHLDRLADVVGDVVTPTRHRYVDLSSAAERAAATDWWLELTGAGGEGMVVKPAHLVGGGVQPGLKVRGREYLRLVYGPDYLDSLDLLRGRNTGKKGSLAVREHGLGLESLSLFVDREPLWRVHQAVFAVLALESEPVDPRL
jgi:polynucleotide kinase-phosphatase